MLLIGQICKEDKMFYRHGHLENSCKNEDVLFLFVLPSFCDCESVLCLSRPLYYDLKFMHLLSDFP